MFKGGSYITNILFEIENKIKEEKVKLKNKEQDRESRLLGYKGL